MKFIKLFALSILSLMIITSCGDEDPDPQDMITVSAEDFELTLDENPDADFILGVVSATTNDGSITYSLTQQSVSGAIAINASNGRLTVASMSAFDFETNPIITATYEAVNGTISDQGSITITLNDVDETVAPTFQIWDGPNITFEKVDGADPSSTDNQDKLTDNVIITRDNDGGQIYNVASESSATKETSPAGTEWALGDVSQIETLTFRPFRTAVGDPKDIVGKALVLHLIEDDIYLNVQFTKWSQGKDDKGGFAYTRASE